MLNKIKKIFVISISSVLLITQPITICQAKLKPGQFNKEMLRWIEPYKERDDVPDSWTWYPEYDLNDRYGILPEGARITNESDEETEDLFYDHYWNNNAWRGGFNEVFHSKSVGFTKESLNSVSRTNDFDRPSLGSEVFKLDASSKKFNKKAEFKYSPFVCRQVSKDIEMYTGVLNAGILVKMELKKYGIDEIKVYIAFIKNGDISDTYDITCEYLLYYDDFSYSNLEKAIDKFCTVCYNYNAYIGGPTEYVNGIMRSYTEYASSNGDNNAKYQDKAVLDFSRRFKFGMSEKHMYGIYVLGFMEKYFKEVNK